MATAAVRQRPVLWRKESTDEDAEGSAASMSTTSRQDTGAAPAPAGSAALPHTPQPSEEPAARNGSSQASTTADSFLENAERTGAASTTAAAAPAISRPSCKVASSICKAAGLRGRLRPTPALDAGPAAPASLPLDPAAAAAALREQSALEAAAINSAAREQAARHAAERARAAAELEAVESARRCLQARLMLVRDTAALRREEAAAAAHGGTAGWGRAVAEMQGRLDAARQQAAAEYEAAEAAAAEEKARWAQRQSAAVAALAALQRAATAELQHLQSELGVAFAEAAGSCGSLAAKAGAAGAEAAADAHALVMQQPAVQLPDALLPAPLQLESGPLKGISGALSAHASSVARVPTPQPFSMAAAAVPQLSSAPWAVHPVGSHEPAAVVQHCGAACSETVDEEWHDCEEDGQASPRSPAHPPAQPAAHALAQEPAAAASSGRAPGRRGAGGRRGRRGRRHGDQGGCCAIM